jgi:hypothetical protein
MGETLLTDTERQARYRAARAAGPWVIRTPHPVNHRSRAQCWHDIIARLWHCRPRMLPGWQPLPANLQDSAPAEALQVIRNLNLGEFQAIEPAHGFGRD